MLNVSQMNAIFGINNSQQKMNGLLEQLQTGNRINKAADDASGLAISNQLKSQHMGLDQGTKNAQNANALLNIADSALNTYKETLDTMRTKAITASSSTESGASRQALQDDINKLMSSIKQIVSNTAYNGIKLLDGTFTNKNFQVGAYANQTVGVSISDSSVNKMGNVNNSVGAVVSAGTTAANLSINGEQILQSTVSAVNKDGANLIAEAINAKTGTTNVRATALTEVTGAAVVGGLIADGDLSINGISIGSVNVGASDGTGSLVNAINNISNQTGVSASIIAGRLELKSEDGNNIHITEANGGAAKAGLTVGENYGKITLTSTNSDAITVENATAVSGLNSLTTTSKNLSDVDVTTYESAQEAIDIFSNAIKQLDAIRSSVGSSTNQLDRVISVNQVTSKNIKEAEETIRGADVAQVRTDLDNWSIKNQAATFAFSMAAQSQQNILRLFQ